MANKLFNYLSLASETGTDRNLYAFLLKDFNLTQVAEPKI